MGYRIELGEIESVATAVEGVDVSVCLYDKDNDELVLIYVGKKADESDVKSALDSALPTYMLPAKIVKASSIPYNQNGKTDRKALAGEYFKK
jgi:acyl-CoA synthetase (AMP-forming)/AMP-acid ligase II